MPDDQWRWWREALAGKMPDSEPGQPRAGFWKNRDEPIAIWWEGDQVYCERQKIDGSRMKADEIDALYASCSRYPISEEVYRAVAERGEPWPRGYETRLTLNEIREGKVWTPELGLAKLGPVVAAGQSATAEPAPQETDAAENPRAVMGGNQPPEEMTPDRALAAEISGHAAVVKAWLGDIGGAPKTKAEADRVADYATTFGQLAKRAETERVAEKEPHLKACRDIDAKWNGVKSNADSARKRCLEIAQTWMDQENARIAEEARKANEAAAAAAEKAARQSDEPVAPPPPAEPERVRAVGNMRSVSTRTRIVWIVTDPRAYGAYLLGMESVPPDLLDALHKVAQRQGAAGVSMPGVVKEEKRSAA